MSILIDSLPKTVSIDGMEYPIHTDFRAAINFELLMSGSLEDYEKTEKALQIFYGDYVPVNLQAALDKILWFYTGGKDEVQKELGNKTYFFDHDDEYIYSAFRDQYDVNLQTVDYMHWWEFLAMFKSLRDDNEISKIIGYRAVKIDSKMSKEQKAFYKKMKRMYAPKKDEEEVKRQKELDDMLMQR